MIAVDMNDKIGISDGIRWLLFQYYKKQTLKAYSKLFLTSWICRGKPESMATYAWQGEFWGKLSTGEYGSLLASYDVFKVHSAVVLTFSYHLAVPWSCWWHKPIRSGLQFLKVRHPIAPVEVGKELCPDSLCCVHSCVVSCAQLPAEMFVGCDFYLAGNFATTFTVSSVATQQDCAHLVFWIKIGMGEGCLMGSLQCWNYRRGRWVSMERILAQLLIMISLHTFVWNMTFSKSTLFMCSVTWKHRAMSQKKYTVCVVLKDL